MNSRFQLSGEQNLKDTVSHKNSTLVHSTLIHKATKLMANEKLIKVAKYVEDANCLWYTTLKPQEKKIVPEKI